MINLGGLAYGSYRLTGIVDEALAYTPDLVIIMCGSNEFLEPRHYGEFMESLRAVRSHRRFTAGPTRALSGGTARTTGGGPAAKIAGTSFVGDRGGALHRPRPGGGRSHPSTLRSQPRAHGRGLSSGWRQGRPLYRGFEPPRSKADRLECGGRPLPEGDLGGGCRRGSAAPGGSGRAGAGRTWRSTAKEPRSADLHFAAARTLDGLRRYDEAKAAYLRAKDLDAFPHRALSSFNDTVRRVAREQGALLFDAEEVLMRASPEGMPGWNVFMDQCHPNPTGHALLASALAEIVDALVRDR